MPVKFKIIGKPKTWGNQEWSWRESIKKAIEDANIYIGELPINATFEV